MLSQSTASVNGSLNPWSHFYRETHSRKAELRHVDPAARLTQHFVHAAGSIAIEDRVLYQKCGGGRRVVRKPISDNR